MVLYYGEQRLAQRRTSPVCVRIPGGGYHGMTNMVDTERVEQGRKTLLADDAYADLVETFRVLVDTSRLKIVHSLLGQELCTCELAAITGNSESVASQHLRVLRQLRLVTSRRSGRRVFYRLQDTPVRSLLALCLTQMDHAGPAQRPAVIPKVRAGWTADVA